MKTIKKIIKWVFIVFFVVVAIDATIVFSFAHSPSHIEKADAIIVMGAAINSPAVHNRTLKALELYEQGMADVIVLSGGRISEEDISEATYMQRVLQQNTEQALNLILEEESTSTYENIRNSKEKLGKGKSIIIVTDKYHIARSVLVAMRAGFTEITWASPEVELSNEDFSYHYLREMAAMINYIPKFIGN